MCASSIPGGERVRNALSRPGPGGLGQNILGSSFSFTIDVMEEPLLCLWQETALIASLESRRGMPRPRPPFPAQSGLDGKPTIINNVKTLAAAAAIVGRGAEWFAGLGTEKSKGTAVFALTGKINNSGLVEVPMGTPLSRIIFDIGGGIPRGKEFKAVQTAGHRGLHRRFMDTPVEYESLAAGAYHGLGGMVVMDYATCMVEIARYLSFTQEESCGNVLLPPGDQADAGHPHPDHSGAGAGRRPGDPVEDRAYGEGDFAGWGRPAPTRC